MIRHLEYPACDSGAYHRRSICLTLFRKTSHFRIQHTGSSCKRFDQTGKNTRTKISIFYFKKWVCVYPTVAQLDWKLTSSQVINLCFITSVALVCRVFPLRSRTDEVNKLCLQSILSRTVFNCTATSCYLPTPVLISTLSQLHLTVLTNLYPPACFLTDDHFDEN